MSGSRRNNQDHVKLSEAPLGSTYRITGLSATGPPRRRLLDVGFVPGACVVPVRRSPAGDPTAYSVRGTLIALRRREADRVTVQVLPGPRRDPRERPSAAG
ncbi:MAG: FeoA family protein [Betaproteobacteria bacterium]